MDKIEWGEPIEAVHDGGNVGKANVVSVGKDDITVTWETTTRSFRHKFYENGTPHPGISLWRIRNVAKDNATIDPETVKACIAALPYPGSAWTKQAARAIEEALLPVIDPDILAVREILGACGGGNSINHISDDDPDFQDALAAYRRHKGKESGE